MERQSFCGYVRIWGRYELFEGVCVCVCFMVVCGLYDSWCSPTSKGYSEAPEPQPREVLVFPESDSFDFKVKIWGMGLMAEGGGDLLCFSSLPCEYEPMLGRMTREEAPCWCERGWGLRWWLCERRWIAMGAVNMLGGRWWGVLKGTEWFLKDCERSVMECLQMKPKQTRSRNLGSWLQTLRNNDNISSSSKNKVVNKNKHK